MKNRKKFFSFLLIALSAIFCIGSLNLSAKTHTVSASTGDAPKIYYTGSNGLQIKVGSIVEFGEYPQTFIQGLESDLEQYRGYYTYDSTTGYNTVNKDMGNYLKAGEKFYIYKAVENYDSKYVLDSYSAFNSSTGKGTEVKASTVAGQTTKDPRKIVTDTETGSQNAVLATNGYDVNVNYCFKVEPIKWKVTASNNGKFTLVSTLVLDAMDFNLYDSNGNIWTYSYLRNWLNYGSDYDNKEYGVLQRYNYGAGNRRFTNAWVGEEIVVSWTFLFWDYECTYSPYFLDFVEWFDYSDSSVGSGTSGERSDYLRKYVCYNYNNTYSSSVINSYNNGENYTTSSYEKNEVSDIGINTGSRDSMLIKYESKGNTFYKMAFSESERKNIVGQQVTSSGNYPGTLKKSTVDNKTVYSTMNGKDAKGDYPQKVDYSTAQNYSILTSENRKPYMGSSSSNPVPSITSNDYVTIVSEDNKSAITGYSDFAKANGFALTNKNSDGSRSVITNGTSGEGFVWCKNSDRSDDGVQVVLGSASWNGARNTSTRDASISSDTRVIHNERDSIKVTFNDGCAQGATTEYGSMGQLYGSMDQSYGVVPQIVVNAEAIAVPTGNYKEYIVGSDNTASDGKNYKIEKYEDSSIPFKVGAFATEFASDVGVTFGSVSKSGSEYTIQVENVKGVAPGSKLMLACFSTSLSSSELENKMFNIGPDVQYVYLNNGKSSVKFTANSGGNLNVYAFYITNNFQTIYAVSDGKGSIAKLKQYTYFITTISDEGRSTEGFVIFEGMEYSLDVPAWERDSSDAPTYYFTDETNALVYKNNPENPMGQLNNAGESLKYICSGTNDLFTSGSYIYYKVTTAKRVSVVTNNANGSYYFKYDKVSLFPSGGNDQELYAIRSGDKINLSLYVRNSYLKSMLLADSGSIKYKYLNISSETIGDTLKLTFSFVENEGEGENKNKVAVPVKFDGTPITDKEIYYIIDDIEVGSAINKVELEVRGLSEQDEYAISFTGDTQAKFSNGVSTLNNIKYDSDVTSGFGFDDGYYLKIDKNDNGANSFKVPTINFSYSAIVKDANGYRYTQDATYPSGDKYGGQYVRIAKNGVAINFDGNGNRVMSATITATGINMSSYTLTRGEDGVYSYENGNTKIKCYPIYEVKYYTGSNFIFTETPEFTYDYMYSDYDVNKGYYISQINSICTGYLKILNNDDKVTFYRANNLGNMGAGISARTGFSGGDKFEYVGDSVKLIVSIKNFQVVYTTSGASLSYDNTKKEPTGGSVVCLDKTTKTGLGMSGNVGGTTVDVDVQQASSKYYSPWIEYVSSKIYKEYGTSGSDGTETVGLSGNEGKFSLSTGVFDQDFGNNTGNKVWFIKRINGRIDFLTKSARANYNQQVDKDMLYGIISGVGTVFAVDSINIDVTYNVAQNNIDMQFTFDSVVSDISFSFSGISQYDYKVIVENNLDNNTRTIDGLKLYVRNNSTGFYDKDGVVVDKTTINQLTDIEGLRSCIDATNMDGEIVTIFMPITIGNNYFYLCPGPDDVKEITRVTETLKYNGKVLEDIYTYTKSGNNVFYIYYKETGTKIYNNNEAQTFAGFKVVPGNGCSIYDGENLLGESDLDKIYSLEQLAGFKYTFTNTYSVVTLKAQYKSCEINVSVYGWDWSETGNYDLIKKYLEDKDHTGETDKFEVEINIEDGSLSKYYLKDVIFGYKVKDCYGLGDSRLEEFAKTKTQGAEFLGFYRDMGQVSYSSFSEGKYEVLNVNGQSMYVSFDKKEVLRKNPYEEGWVFDNRYTLVEEGSAYYSMNVTLITLFKTNKYSVEFDTTNLGGVDNDGAMNIIEFDKSNPTNVFDGRNTGRDLVYRFNFTEKYSQNLSRLDNNSFIITVGGNKIAPMTSVEGGTETRNYNVSIVDGKDCTITIYSGSIIDNIVIKFKPDDGADKKLFSANSYIFKIIDPTTTKENGSGNSYNLGIFAVTGASKEENTYTAEKSYTFNSTWNEVAKFSATWAYDFDAKPFKLKVKVGETEQSIDLKTTNTNGVQFDNTEIKIKIEKNTGSKSNEFTISVDRIICNMQFSIDETNSNIELLTYKLKDASVSINSESTDRNQALTKTMFSSELKYGSSDVKVDKDGAIITYGTKVTLTTTVSEVYSDSIPVFDIHGIILIPKPSDSAEYRAIYEKISNLNNKKGIGENNTFTNEYNSFLFTAEYNNKEGKIHTLSFPINFASRMVVSDVVVSVTLYKIEGTEAKQSTTNSNYFDVNNKNSSDLSGYRAWANQDGTTSGTTYSANLGGEIKLRYTPTASYTQTLPLVKYLNNEMYLPFGLYIQDPTASKYKEDNNDPIAGVKKYILKDSTSNPDFYVLRTMSTPTTGSDFTNIYQFKFFVKDNKIVGLGNNNFLNVLTVTLYAKEFTAFNVGSSNNDFDGTIYENIKLLDGSYYEYSFLSVQTKTDQTTTEGSVSGAMAYDILSTPSANKYYMGFVKIDADANGNILGAVKNDGSVYIVELKDKSSYVNPFIMSGGGYNADYRYSFVYNGTFGKEVGSSAKCEVKDGENLMHIYTEYYSADNNGTTSFATENFSVTGHLVYYVLYTEKTYNFSFSKNTNTSEIGYFEADDRHVTNVDATSSVKHSRVPSFSFSYVVKAKYDQSAPIIEVGYHDLQIIWGGDIQFGTESSVEKYNITFTNVSDISFYYTLGKYKVTVTKVSDAKYEYALINNETLYVTFTVERQELSLSNNERKSNEGSVKYIVTFTSTLDNGLDPSESGFETSNVIGVSLISNHMAVNIYTLTKYESLYRETTATAIDLTTATQIVEGKVYYIENGVNAGYYLKEESVTYKMQIASQLKSLNMTNSNLILTEYYATGVEVGTEFAHGTEYESYFADPDSVRGYTFNCWNEEGDIKYAEKKLYYNLNIYTKYKENYVAISFNAKLYIADENIGELTPYSTNATSTKNTEVLTVSNPSSNISTTGLKFGSTTTFTITLNRDFSQNTLKFSVKNDPYAVVNSNYTDVTNDGSTTRKYTATLQYVQGASCELVIEADNGENTALKTKYQEKEKTIDFDGEKIYRNIYIITIKELDKVTYTDYDSENADTNPIKDGDNIYYSKITDVTFKTTCIYNYSGSQFAHDIQLPEGWGAIAKSNVYTYYTAKTTTEEAKTAFIDTMINYYKGNGGTTAPTGSNSVKIGVTSTYSDCLYRDSELYLGCTRNIYTATIYDFCGDVKKFINVKNGFAEFVDNTTENNNNYGLSRAKSRTIKFYHNTDISSLLGGEISENQLVKTDVKFIQTDQISNALVDINGSGSIANSRLVSEESKASSYALIFYQRKEIETVFTNDSNETITITKFYGESFSDEDRETVKDLLDINLLTMGYHYVGWILNGENYSETDKTLDYVVREGATFVPNQVPNTYTIKLETENTKDLALVNNTTDIVVFDKTFTIRYDYVDGYNNQYPTIKFKLGDSEIKLYVDSGTIMNQYFDNKTIQFAEKLLYAQVVGTGDDAEIRRFENGAEITIVVCGVVNTYSFANTGHGGSSGQEDDVVNKGFYVATLTDAVITEGRREINVIRTSTDTTILNLVIDDSKKAQHNGTQEIVINVNKSYHFNSVYNFKLNDGKTSKEYSIKFEDLTIESDDWFSTTIEFENIQGNLTLTLLDTTNVQNNDYTITFKVAIGGGVSGWNIQTIYYNDTDSKWSLSANDATSYVALLSNEHKVTVPDCPNLDSIFGALTNWYIRIDGWYTVDLGATAQAIDWSAINSSTSNSGINGDTVYQRNTTLYAIFFVSTVNVSAEEKTELSKGVFKLEYVVNEDMPNVATADMHDPKLNFDGYRFSFRSIIGYTKNIPVITIKVNSGTMQIALLPYEQFRSMTVGQTATAGYVDGVATQTLIITRTENGYTYSDVVVTYSESKYTFKRGGNDMNVSVAPNNDTFNFVLNNIKSNIELSSNQSLFEINKYTITYVLPDGTKVTETVEHDQKVVSVPEVEINFLQKIRYRVTYANGTSELVNANTLKELAIGSDAKVEVVVSINLIVLISIIVGAVALIGIIVFAVIRTKFRRQYKMKSAKENSDAFARLREQQNKQDDNNNGENGPKI